MRPSIRLGAALSLAAASAYGAGSSPVAVSPDDHLVASVNPDSGSVTLADPRTWRVRELKVGRAPRTLAFSDDSRLLAVADHGSDTVSLLRTEGAPRRRRVRVGSMPYGVVVDGSTRAFVAEFGAGTVAAIDLEKGAVERRVTVDAFPAGLALAGDLLLVTHFFSGRVSALDRLTLEPRGSAPAPSGANLSQSVTVSPDGTRAYLPQTRSNAANTARTFDTTVFPVINVLDVARRAWLPAARLSPGAAGPAVNLPFGAAVSPDGRRLYVANAGSDDVSAFDLATGRTAGRARVGAHPRGLALSRDGRRLFVGNALDGTLSVLEAGTLAVSTTVTLTRLPLPPAVLEGKRLFHSAGAPGLSSARWISCASCHPDGGMDGRTWQGFPDGPRNTPALFGAARTLPLHWSGDLDELHDVELTVRSIQFGAGLVDGEAHDSLGPPQAGRSARLDALAAYLAGLEAPASPHPAAGDAAARGASIFRARGCASCHVPPLYTDGRRHDVGTGDPARERNPRGYGTSFDTPSLRHLWLTAPYFHDGSAATLADVFRTGSAHRVPLSAAELADLIAFLLSLGPDRTSPGADMLE